MTRTSIISFMALTIGIGGALAAGIGLDERGYGDQLPTLEKVEMQLHASTLFSRADVNGDSKLDSDEYAALSIVTAELSLLNGFVAFEFDHSAKIVTLPIAAPGALTVVERSRVDAISRNEFYAAAGQDGAMSADEFIALKATSFSKADRNRNGTLAKSELIAFAVSEAKVTAASGA